MTVAKREFIPVSIAVLTVSDSRTEADDKSGQLLVSRLEGAGHILFEKTIVPDNIFEVRAVISRWIADPGVQVVLTTGGTGVTGFDGTPEAVTPLLEKTLEGFGEVFRMISYEEIGTSTRSGLCRLKVAGFSSIRCSEMVGDCFLGIEVNICLCCSLLRSGPIFSTRGTVLASS